MLIPPPPERRDLDDLREKGETGHPRLLEEPDSVAPGPDYDEPEAVPGGGESAPVPQPGDPLPDGS